MEKNKIKVAVVGAGVSGLISGIYSVKSGFDVTIYEQHFAPGGVAASWSRKGFLFEGGMHWLTGSNDKIPLYNIWKEVGALSENNPVTYRDPVYSILLDNNDSNENKMLHHYRDVEKFRSHLIEMAPEDKKAINMLINDIKAFSNMIMPIWDVKGVKVKNKLHPSLMTLIKMAPAGLNYFRLNRMSEDEYIGKFKNENIKHLLKTQVGYRYNALSLIFTMAGFAMGDYGFPAGGSTRMSENMVNNFLSLGGKIQYKSKVQKISVKEGKVNGLYIGEEFIPYDAVIVSQDARRAVDDLFEKPFDDEWVRHMKKNCITEQNMYLGLGINADLSSYPDCFVIPLKTPFEFAGLKFSELRVNNYAKKREYSAEGKTSLTCLLLGDSYEWWKNAKADGSYRQKKQELMEKFIEILEKYIPEIKGNIEVTDVATPLTYERYCSSYQGSWMSVYPAKSSMYIYPSSQKKVKGLYFEGQRMRMPGGLPITAVSARAAAQCLCRDFNAVFQN